jgi:CheY-like chemotaxis protein
MPGPDDSAQSGGLRVLVVDDAEINRIVAQALLGKMGHESDAVESGLEAVERACTGRYDIVLMDIQMPDIDGEEAARRIRQRLGAATPRIVAMTAHSVPGDRERFLAAGLDGYLTKPMEPEALAAELGGLAPPAAGRERAEFLVDRGHLRALLKYDNEKQSMVRDILNMFLRDAPLYLDAVRSSCARNDYPQLARDAHMLKGAASNAAAPALAAAAAHLEALARGGEGEDAAKLVESLDMMWQRTAVALAGEIDRLGGVKK